MKKTGTKIFSNIQRIGYRVALFEQIIWNLDQTDQTANYLVYIQGELKIT